MTKQKAAKQRLEDLKPLGIELKGPYITLKISQEVGNSAQEKQILAKSEIRIYNDSCSVLVLADPDGGESEKKIFGSFEDCLNDLGYSYDALHLTPKFGAEVVAVFAENAQWHRKQAENDVKKAFLDAKFPDQPTEEPVAKPDFYEKLSPFQKIGYDMGTLVTEKNAAYGNSFAVFPRILKIMFPNGIRPDQYMDLSNFFRQFDKWSRIFTNPKAFGENPRKDLLGYNILGVFNSELAETEGE